MDKFLYDLRSVIREGEDLVKHGVEELKDTGTMARKKLSSAANTTRDTYHLLEKRTADSIKATDRMVRKHPYKSTGIGVGIGIGMGLIAGMMLMNRRRHSLFSWK